MKLIHCEDIEIGDFVAISINNYMTLGFYAGRGKNASFQYYDLNTLAWWLNNPNKKKLLKKNHIKYFVSRVIKYSPEFLKKEYKEMFEEAIEALTQLKVKK